MLSAKDVKHIASLSRIGIEDKEVEDYQKNLSTILDYFKELEELNTDGIEPIGHITGRDNISRGDLRVEKSELERKAILDNSPEKKDDYIKVKSVL